MSISGFAWRASARARAPWCALSLLFGACSADGSTSATSTSTDSTGTVSAGSVAVASVACRETYDLTNAFTVASAMASNTVDHERLDDYTVPTTADSIVLGASSISTNSSGVSIAGTVATISKAGTYRLTGTIADGQVVVSTSDTAVVRLILDNASITRLADAPVVIKKATRVAVILASGTTNRLTDGATYPAGVDQNATLFSKVNLSIAGDGALVVKGNFEDGIASKDGLVIRSGTISVTAADDGIRGKDYLVVRGGSLTVNAGGDALKSDEDGDAALGYVLIAGGTLNLTAANDAVQGETDVLMTGGSLTAKTANGSTTLINDTLSAKGLKASALLVVDGGTVSLNTSDDGLHSNGRLVVNGGTFSISAADDGVHADSALTVNGGTIDVTKSYEGLENAASDMFINGGIIRLVSSDDALNVSGAGDTSPGQAAGAYTLRMTGGRVVVNSTGDGIDVNGSIAMSGGCFIVHGPTANNNAPLDYDGTFTMTGGFVIAAGSSGMAQAPGAASTIPSILVTLSTARPAGTLLHVQSASGTSIVDFAPLKAYQSVVIASPLLAVGGSYAWYFGGSESGTAQDGLYTTGIYTPGSLYRSFTLSSIASRLTM